MLLGLVSALGVGALLAVILGVVFGVLAAVARPTWGHLQAHFPAEPVAPGAALRHGETFIAGMLRMRGRVTIATDLHFLHDDPGVLRRLIWCKPISIPWWAVQPGGDGLGWLRRATIAGVSVRGPKWCLPPWH